MISTCCKQILKRYEISRNVMKSVCKRSFSSVQVNTQPPEELQKVPLIHDSDVDDDSVSNPGIDGFGRAYGTGKKKTSIARVWIKDGSGQFLVNDRRFIDYFQPIQREYALGSFVASNTSGFFDVWCTVKGGGMSGQAGAIRLGISRALLNWNPLYRRILGPVGMLTRDSRRVERKKFGQKKARKKFQWVKR